MSEKRFFAIAFLVLSITAISYGKNKKKAINEDPFVVVLDAGHGGHDPGNLGNGYLEKNIALGIVLKVGALLEKEPNIKVVYTRKDDTFVDLFVRGEIANKANADLFVSVHCDSHTSNAHGAGTFVLGLHANKQNFAIAKKENSVIYLEDNYETRYADYDINSPESVIGLTIMQEEFLDQSILLAKIMQEQFSDKLKRNDRKVKQAGFIVLHQTFMPSVLVETGFLTNRDEGAYLNSYKGQTQMGTAIARAILLYKERIAANVADAPVAIAPVPSPDDQEKNEVVEEVTTIAKSPVDDNTAAVVVEEVKENVLSRPKEINAAARSQDNQKKSKVMEEVATVARSSEDHSNTSAVGEVNENVPLEQKNITTTPPMEGKDTASVKPQEETPKNEVPARESENPDVETSTQTRSEAANPLGKILFKVQLLASSKDLSLVPQNFNGLSRISKEPYKDLFRYLYGSTSFYREAKMLKSNADLKGYPTSYIVAYKDGKRIPIKEALKYIGE